MQHVTDINTAQQALSHFMEQYPRLLVLTGAGISTDSGIPAYRDQAANWQRPQPVQHQAFMSQPAVRQRFWARSLIGWPVMRDAKPNLAHQALVALEQQGTLLHLITQNVDGLHQKAGHLAVTDLHGRSDQVTCMSCEYRLSRNAAHQQMAQMNPSFCHLQATAAPDGDADLELADFSAFEVPNCPLCNGILKPDVVFFGDNVPRDKVQQGLDTLYQADALLVIGSSLMVYSGFRFCKRAHEHKIPIAALNQGKTRADSLLTLKLACDIRQTLQPFCNN